MGKQYMAYWNNESTQVEPIRKRQKPSSLLAKLLIFNSYSLNDVA
jgi:hypothetical protein